MEQFRDKSDLLLFCLPSVRPTNDDDRTFLALLWYSTCVQDECRHFDKRQRSYFEAVV